MTGFEFDSKENPGMNLAIQQWLLSTFKHKNRSHLMLLLMILPFLINAYETPRLKIYDNFKCACLGVLIPIN